MKGLDNYNDHLLNQYLDPSDFKRRRVDVDVDEEDLQEEE